MSTDLTTTLTPTGTIATGTIATGTIATGRDEHRGRAVVVGVDGSPASIAAVDFAVAEARRRGIALELMHAYDVPIYATDPLGMAYVAIDLDELATAAQAVLAEEADRVARLAPDLPVRTVLHQGSAGTMLIEASKDGAMVVVGAKHRGEFAELVLGSVCHKVLHHAHCPVVLVPQASFVATRSPSGKEPS